LSRLRKKSWLLALRTREGEIEINREGAVVLVGRGSKTVVVMNVEGQATISL
jgi:hypothetical protein